MGIQIDADGAGINGEHQNVPAVVEAAGPVKAPALRSTLAVPAMIADAGDHAARRFLEFFAATIRNKNTRMAYYRAACHFFAWVEQHQIGELADIEPIHVAAYIEGLQATAAKPTVKLHLAAIRMLFDWLVVGQVLAVNPAHAVRGPKHVVKRGKTPVLTEEEARRLLEGIKVVRKTKMPDGTEAETPWVVGLRDRALMAVMTYSLARIGAVVAMQGRGLLPGGQALVGAPPRERRQAPRDAGAPQARAVPRRIHRSGRDLWRRARAPSSAPPPASRARSRRRR